MESILCWASNDKVDSMTLWMLRRLLKFCLKKYIGPYIRGELDLEQLDFHLRSAVHLNDVSLNVDAINAKLDHYPFEIKEGSVGRITLKLSPQLNIELDGVELRFVPQTPTNVAQPNVAPFESNPEVHQSESVTGHEGSAGMEGCSYSPVREGVRVVADLFERLFFGVHVILSRVFIAVEELPKSSPPEDSNSTSRCMLLCRIGCAQYKANRSAGTGGGDRQGEESSTLTSDISFAQMCLELVDIYPEGCEDLSSGAESSKAYGEPISLMEDDAGLSGHLKLSINTNSGSLAMPKIDADFDLDYIRLHFTAQQMQQLLRVICSYCDTDKSTMATARGINLNNQINQIASSSNELSFANKPTDTHTMDCKRATFPKLAMVGSQSSDSGSSLLPGAKLFADWVHCNDQENDCKETLISEEDLAASTEEFFDCLSGSELWTWTCPAFSDISLATSLVSESVLLSQAASSQVPHVIKVKIAGFSVILKEDLSSDHYIEAIVVNIDLFVQVCPRRLEGHLLLKHIEAFQVQHHKHDVNVSHELGGGVNWETVSVSVQPLQALVEQSVPKFPVSLFKASPSRRASAVPRKCILRLSDEGQLAGLQVDVKHKLSPPSVGDRNLKRQDLTEVGFHFQPLVLWVDAPIICTLLNLAEIFGCSTGDAGKRALSADTGFSPPSTRKLHFSMFFSCIRLWVCSPYSSESKTFWKDHVLCLDLSCPVEKLRRPMFKLRLSDKVSDRLCIASASLESYFYLVSPSVQNDLDKDSALGFHANKVLSISFGSPEPAIIEILRRSKSGGGISLAERAWTGIAEQQKGGMVATSEFAAATATEVMDENNCKLRDDISLSSSTCILVAVPKVKVELLASKHTVLVETLISLVEASTSRKMLNGECLVDQKDNNQVSISLDVGGAELVLDPNFRCSTALETKTSSPWEHYLINISKLQMLHVVKLGMVKNANYFWLRHGNGCVKGLLSNVSRQLLTFSDDALGRGDGGGGNALVTKSAGIEVSVISWPEGGHAEDTLISVALRGCTFMAHGGRLDWLPGLITFFSQHAGESSIGYAIHEKSCLSTTGTRIARLEAGLRGAGEEASLSNTHVLFSLDLHDAALCYEPGKEAISAAMLRAKNTTEPFDPVACSLAAAAVHVSRNAISNTAGENYKVQLRDVGLLLADTTSRRSNVLDYTPESLHQAGYVKVAGEAVMGAVVHIYGGDGPEWEVESASNQIRLDTCHDTTAALGRLIAQMQQLFVPEVEHSVAKQSAEGKVDEKFEMLSKSPLLNDDVPRESQHTSLVQWSWSGGEEEDLQIPVSQSEESPALIEDYYISKLSSLRSSSGSSCHRDNGASLRNSRAPSDSFDVLSRVHGSGGWYEGPSFKVVENRVPARDSRVDGSGGWYDGPSFKVVENHVPARDSRSGSQKHRGNLLDLSKSRPRRFPGYPQSVGRVVLRDLNLRWRLYEGSDWPSSKRKDPEATSARQSGVCMELIMNGVNLQYDMFPRMGIYASRLALSIQEVDFYDCSKDAPWKKVLGYYQSKSRPRETSAKALKVELESVRPTPLVPVEEHRLSVQVLPLLLHLDQRHVDFLANFFAAPLPSSQQLRLGYDEIASSYSSFEREATDGSEDALLPFFQICELQPFSIRVDYVPRHVDIAALRSGNYGELANLVSWKGIELELKRVRVTGVRGWETLSSIVVGEWLEDVSQNQIHKLLKGVGPARPLFAVGSGAVKLVRLPAEQYKRDRRRLLQAMRKGATAFLRSLSLEAVGLGVQVAAGAHEILRKTESALGSVGLISSSEKVEVRAKVCQPEDMREGMLQAYESLSQGLERTASSLIGNPLKAYHKAGSSAAVASALQAAPTAAVAPAVAAAGALHRALLGVRNSLDPERRRESEEKHSGPPPE